MRVVENQIPSLIDNIFSNNLSDEIISRNIYITLSEHFCQFVTINRGQNIKIHVRNYSNFSNKDFYHDVSIQNWNYEIDNPTDSFNYFFWGLETTYLRYLKKDK